MKLPRARKMSALVLMLLFFRFTAAGAVRVSFLAEKSAVEDTVAFLRSNRCPQENCDAFERAAERYFSVPFDFDLSKFPPPSKGFYTFASVSNLVAALPYPPDGVHHPWELNCFDTTILLTGGLLRMRQGPDERFGTFLAPCPTLTNNIFEIRPSATPREAFLASCPQWCREVTDVALPRVTRDARTSLTAALYRFYRLPESANEKTLREEILAGLRTAWKEEGMRFPNRFEVVLCHEVRLPQPFSFTCHASLLYRRQGGGYTYIEKAGGCGPFVRLDLEDRGSLLDWLAGTFKAIGDPGSSQRFATFNDTEIRALGHIR